MSRRSVKIAYIGGGSKAWARSFMQDLALAPDLAGEVALYDIDVPAAERNQIIGTKIQEKEEALSDFRYTVSQTLEEALTGADFVIISILPGTFTQMHTDVHAPEEYGILQSVGDTVGPGGVFRALRTVPVYEVLNLTNPMSICVKTLYRCFPQIKAFGCCHEVFHTQDFLCCVLKELTGIEVKREDIYTDASGINHFTWITEARYQNIDLMKLMPEFMDRYFDTGYYENGPADQWTRDTFAYGNRVKMDLLKKYGALAAAGDRHLVEFVDNSWYLKDRETVKKWHFGLTTVDWRIANQDKLIRESVEMAEGRREVPLAPSGEALVDMLRGIMGLKTVITNVNLPNRGQMPGLPEGSIVETNCIFTNGFVDPIVSKPLPAGALALVRRNSDNIDLLSEGIAERDEKKIFAVFINQPLCAGLEFDKAIQLFNKMRVSGKTI